MTHVLDRRARRATRWPLRRRPDRRRVLHAALAATVLATVAALLPTAAVGAAPADGVPVIHVEGRGHGHGVGLSQWGARSMAAAGADAASILAHYYPGTTLEQGGGEVVVVVGGGGRTTISLPQGGEIRSARSGAQAQGFPIAVQPGESVTVHHDGGGYRVERGGVRAVAAGQAQPYQEDCVLLCPPPEEQPPAEPEPQPEPQPAPEPQPEGCVICPPPDDGAPPPAQPGPGQPPPPGAAPAPTPPPPSGAPSSPTPVWAVPNGGGTVHVVDRGRTYRGQLEVAGGPGALRVRNHVDVEDYLRGMAEVPGSWPAAAVQAQAVAARTYALRAMAAGGEICDTESCQVYAGVEREHPGQDAAVAATRGLVLTHGGRLASTFYSASAGGHSATIREGFGSDHDIPYLPARPEPTDDVRPWSLDISLRDVAARLGYPGTVTGVRVDQTGPSGRPVAMTLLGDAGERSVDPQDFRRRLGLRSTLFTLRTAVAGEAPPPPPAPVEDQLVDPTAATLAPQVRSASSSAREVELAAPRHLPPAGAHAAVRAGRLAVVAMLAMALAVAGVVGRRRLAAKMAGWPTIRRR